MNFGRFVAASIAIIVALMHIQAARAVMPSGCAGYYLPRGSVRARIPDRSGHNHDLAAVGNFSPSPLGIQFRSGASSDHLLIPASLWKTIKTVVVMATFNQGSGYRAILGSEEFSLLLDQNGVDFRTYRAPNRMMTHRTHVFSDGKETPFSLGRSRIITWVRSTASDPDQLWIDTRESRYEARAAARPDRSSDVWIGAAPGDGFGFGNTVYAVALFTTRLSPEAVRQAYESIRSDVREAAAAANIFTGIQINCSGNSIMAGTTLPRGPAAGIQSAGWDIASLLRRKFAGVEIFNSAVQGNTTPAVDYVDSMPGASGSGGPVPISADGAYDALCSRHISVRWEGTNYLAVASAEQQIAAQADDIRHRVEAGYEVIALPVLNSAMFLNPGSPLSAKFRAANDDLRKNWGLYGATLFHDMNSRPEFQHPERPDFFWDGYHPNTRGQMILAEEIIRALEQVGVSAN